MHAHAVLIVLNTKTRLNQNPVVLTN